MVKGFIDGLAMVPDGLHRDIMEYECACHFARPIMAAYEQLVAGPRADAAHDDDRPAATAPVQLGERPDTPAP